MLTALPQKFRTWLFRPRIEHGSITLTQRRIFIIPTRQGFTLVFVLVLMLLGDINYNLSLGYVLTFLLTMMAVMSMLHAFRNLAHMEIRSGRAEPVFCGEVAQFMLHFNNRSKLPRYQLCLVQSGDSFWKNTNTPLQFDVPARTGYRSCLSAAHHPARLAAARPPEAVHRIPARPVLLLVLPAFRHALPGLSEAFERRTVADRQFAGRHGKRSMAGDEDFSGLRKYTEGDALPRIDWKAYARERGLQVKQFSTPLGEELWLDIADAPDRDEEEKLARMTRWVLDAEAQGLRYGLHLPNGELPPNSGIVHRDECLRRIALFNLPQQNDPLPNPSPTSGRGARFAPLSRLRERGRGRWKA